MLEWERHQESVKQGDDATSRVDPCWWGTSQQSAKVLYEWCRIFDDFAAARESRPRATSGSAQELPSRDGRSAEPPAARSSSHAIMLATSTPHVHEASATQCMVDKSTPLYGMWIRSCLARSCRVHTDAFVSWTCG